MPGYGLGRREWMTAVFGQAKHKEAQDARRKRNDLDRARLDHRNRGGSERAGGPLLQQHTPGH